MRILLVEDDALLGDGIRAGLKLAGYAVDWLRDGEQGYLALTTEPYAACVLDLGLPRRNGIHLLRDLRAHGNHTPVLILTARDTVADKIAGLDAGADDYLIKPFDLNELQARLRALLRRASHTGAACLHHRGVSLDPAARQVTLHDHAINLSGKEYALLHDFLSHPNAIRPRDELEQGLYAWGEETASNTIEVYIHHLRKKLGASFIETVRGLGYRLGHDT
ncbi:MAG: response regulator [Betaproteobacteria bacterium]|nr:MAG: response regulator [Betaproteobacteria bacterium]